jgi:hypothetical protein
MSTIILRQLNVLSVRATSTVDNEILMLGARRRQRAILNIGLDPLRV